MGKETVLPIAGAVLGAIVGTAVGIGPQLGFAIGMALGTAATALFVDIPKMEEDNNKVYGWDRTNMGSTSGQPIPVLYGEHRITGNVIGQFANTNLEPTIGWDDYITMGHLDYQTEGASLHKVTHLGLKCTGIKISNKIQGMLSGSNINAQASILAPGNSGIQGGVQLPSWLPKIRIRVAIKKTSETEYVDRGDFILDNNGSEIIINTNPDESPMTEDIYDVKITVIEIDQPGQMQNYSWQTSNGGTVTAQEVINDSTQQVFLSTWRHIGAVAENPETLLHTLIALSEGKIESVASVKADDQKWDDLGKTATYEYRSGKPVQTAIKGFEFTSIQVDKNEEIRIKGTDTANGQDPTGIVVELQECDQFEFEFSFAQGLYHQRWHGSKKMIPFDCRIRVDWKLKGQATSAYKVLKDVYHCANTTQKITFTHRLTAPEGSNEYTLRFYIHPNGPYARRKDNPIHYWNAVWLTRVNAISSKTYGYPHTALIGTTLKATDKIKGSPPQITCLVRGVHIQDYTNDTFGWSNNPAWCIADILTHERYGLGDFIKVDDLDIESFKVAAADYDTLVDDGTGKQVKQFTLNYVADEGDSPSKTVQAMLAAARSYLIWTNGKFKLKLDKHGPTVQSFTMDNIVKGSFSFSYMPHHALINQVDMKFFNADKEFEKDFVLIETIDAAAGTEVPRKRSGDLRGVTNWQQAYRLGKYVLLAGRFTAISVNVTVATDSLFADPGDIVEVSHDLTGWVKKPFRILEIREKDKFELQLTLLEHHESIYNLEPIPNAPIAMSVPTVNYGTPPLINNLSTFVSVTEGSPRLQANIEVGFTPPNADRTIGLGLWDHANIYLALHDSMVATDYDPHVAGKFVGTSKNGTFLIEDVDDQEGYWVYITSVSPEGVETPLRTAPRFFTYVSADRTEGRVSPFPGPPKVPKFWGTHSHKMVYLAWSPAEDFIGVPTYEVREGLNFASGIVVDDHISGNNIALPAKAWGTKEYHIKAVDYFGYKSKESENVTVTVGRIGRQRIIVDRNELFLQDGSHDGTNFRQGYLNPTAATVLTLNPAGHWDSGMKWDDHRHRFWDMPTVNEGEYTTGVIDLMLHVCYQIHIDIVWRTYLKWAWGGGHVDLPQQFTTRFIPFPEPHDETLYIDPRGMTQSVTGVYEDYNAFAPGYDPVMDDRLPFTWSTPTEGLGGIDPLGNDSGLPTTYSDGRTTTVPGFTWCHSAMRDFHIDIRTSDDNIYWTDYYNITPGADICSRYAQVKLRMTTGDLWIPIEVEKFRITFDLPERVDAQDVMNTSYLTTTTTPVTYRQPFYHIDSVVATLGASLYSPASPGASWTSWHASDIWVTDVTTTGCNVHTGQSFAGPIHVAAVGY